MKLQYPLTSTEFGFRHELQFWLPPPVHRRHDESQLTQVLFYDMKKPSLQLQLEFINCEFAGQLMDRVHGVEGGAPEKPGSQLHALPLKLELAGQVVQEPLILKSPALHTHTFPL